MNNQHDTLAAMAKIALAWLGALFGGVSLSTVVLLSTLFFTVLQSYALIRKIRRDNRLEKLEAQLKHLDTE